jgi:CheY-like chemotaxis protein
MYQLTGLKGFDNSTDTNVRGDPLAALRGFVTTLPSGQAKADRMTRKGEILVVDDDDDVREVLAETLQEFGYEVERASTAEQALTIVTERPQLRMVITDVRMPGMSGLELADHVRRCRSDVKIIIISGYFQPQPVHDRFLRKPFHMRELASAVEAEFGS